MGYPRGSEEFYSGGVGGYNSDTLSLMQNQQRRLLDQQQRAGDLYAQGTEEAGREMGQMIASVPQSYMAGHDWRQKSDRNAMLNAEENLNLGKMRRQDEYGQRVAPGQTLTNEQRLMEAGLGKEESGALSAKTRADQEAQRFKYGQTMGKNGRTLAEESYGAEYAQPGLQNQATQAGIEQSRASTDLLRKQANSFVSPQRQVNIERAEAIFQAAGDSPEAQQQAAHQARRLGLQDEDIMVAQNNVRRNAAATGQLSELSPQGALLNAKINDLDEKVQSYNDLVAKSKEYSTAMPFSEDEDRAINEATPLLHHLGKDPAQVRGFSADTNGIHTTGAKLKKAAEEARGELQRQLNILKLRAKSFPSARVNQQIMSIEQALNQAGKPDIFGNRQQMEQLRQMGNQFGTIQTGGGGGGGKSGYVSQFRGQ